MLDLQRSQQATRRTSLVDRAALAQLCCLTLRWGRWEQRWWQNGLKMAMELWWCQRMERSWMIHHQNCWWCGCCFLRAVTISFQLIVKNNGLMRRRRRPFCLCGRKVKFRTLQRHLSRLVRKRTSWSSWCKKRVRRMKWRRRRRSQWSRMRCRTSLWSTPSTTSMTRMRRRTMKVMHFQVIFKKASWSTWRRCIVRFLRCSTRRLAERQ